MDPFIHSDGDEENWAEKPDYEPLEEREVVTTKSCLEAIGTTLEAPEETMRDLQAVQADFGFNSQTIRSPRPSPNNESETLVAACGDDSTCSSAAVVSDAAVP